jgi:YidC/Oxa1 family membrane protein insertase
MMKGLLTRNKIPRTLSSHLLSPSQYLARREIISIVQQGLTDFHALSGLPWWATISASTILVKSALLPLVRLQIMASQRLGNAMPEINDLRMLLTKSLSEKSANTSTEKSEALKSFFQGASAILTIHNASFVPLLVYPILNVSVFVTFVISMRGMFDHDTTGALANGGIYWFRDLIAADDTMILPFTAISATYLAIELAFRGGAGPRMLFFKDALQCFVLLAAPITTTLPAGVFCYWIPSSLFGIAQNYLMKQPAVMRLLRIPVPTSSSFRIPKD